MKIYTDADASLDPLLGKTVSLLGYVIIPITNSARDRGWDSIFKWLHNLSVFNTIVIMGIAIIQIFRATTL